MRGIYYITYIDFDGKIHTTRYVGSFSRWQKVNNHKVKEVIEVKRG